MADETEDNKAEAEAPAGKGKLPVMTIAVIAVVMLVEAAVLGALFMAFSSGPDPAQADEKVDDEMAAAEELVELMLIADKFQNSRQGAQSFLYDTSIYVLIKRKYRGTPEEIEAGGGFEAKIDENLGRVRSEIVKIFAEAEPAHLNEPGHESIRGQILERCQERFGDDPEGEPYVQDVVISDWKRFSTDL